MDNLIKQAGYGETADELIRRVRELAGQFDPTDRDGQIKAVAVGLDVSKPNAAVLIQAAAVYGLTVVEVPNYTAKFRAGTLLAFAALIRSGYGRNIIDCVNRMLRETLDRVFVADEQSV